MKGIYEFLQELSENNNREWFQANKPRYEALRAQWLDELQRLLDGMAREVDPRVAYLQAKDCAYRIYRDIRFSADKTPYKTYFSALISPYGRKTDYAAYYIHVGLDERGLYGGLWNPDSTKLKKVRRAIVDNIDEFREILDNPDLRRLYPGWEGRSLKTIPKGYDRDHPDADLLRLVDIGKFHAVDREFFERDDWPENAVRLMAPLQPMLDFINYSIDEDI